MALYDGELEHFTDAQNLSAVIAEFVNYVESTTDYNRVTGSESEKSELKAAVRIAFKKLEFAKIPKMSMNDFAVEGLIGSGNYGRIWKASSVKLGKVAVKQIYVEFQDLTSLWKERDLLIYLKHDLVCNLLAAFYEQDAFLVMEICDGNIETLLNDISEKDVVKFTVQLFQGLQWIHSKRVVHANIKPSKCLVKRNNLAISDFSSAIVLPQSQNYVKLDASHGNPGYLDLKATQDFVFSADTDVFGAACVCFEMDTKQPLLSYYNRHQSNDIYVDAFQNGRVVHLHPDSMPTADMKRETIQNRAQKSRFGELIKKLIVDTNCPSASNVLMDSSLRVLLDGENFTTGETQRNESVRSSEFSCKVDNSYGFGYYRHVPSKEIDLALITFSFNSLDLPLVGKKSGSVESKEKHVVQPYKESLSKKRRHSE